MHILPSLLTELKREFTQLEKYVGWEPESKRDQVRGGRLDKWVLSFARVNYCC